MKIRIKRITAVTHKKDKLVSSHPCLITIEGIHCHEVGVPREFMHVEYCKKTEDEVDSWAKLFGKTESNIHIGFNLETEEEFNRLFKLVKRLAKVNFVLKPSRKIKKCDWSKVYVCHHGGRSKRKQNG